MADMNKHFDDFDKHFGRMQKAASFGIVASAIISLAAIGGLFWLIKHAIDAFAA